jgi:hypothetical protein
LVAEVAVALHVTPEEVWQMDLVDLFTVVDVLTPPKRDDVFDLLAD